MVKQSDFIIASPKTIESMKAKGFPIKSVHTTYKEYLDRLFTEKRKVANEVVDKLPHLDKGVANASVQSLYDEMRECFVLGIPGAAITLSIILLELALKYRLHEERVKDDPNSPWEYIERLDLTKVINELRKRKVITLDEKNKLDEFNSNIRNDYIHYKIRNLVKELVAAEVPSVNTESGEVTIHKNISALDHPYLWFSAKKVVGKKTVVSIADYCISWVNKTLVKKKD